MGKIEWTDRSDWNPIRGCTRHSEGCRNCYAEIMAARFSKPGQWGYGFAHMVDGDHRWTGKVELQADRLTLPLTWRKPAKIFVNSTSDLFHESLPNEAIDRVFAVMALAPQHTFQILTKRSKRMQEYLSARNGMGNGSLCRAINEIPAWLGNRHGALEMPLPNVWIGVSVEDQQRADERIPDLLATPAAVRFISGEPLLSDLDIRWALSRNLLDIAAGFLKRGHFSPGLETLHPLDWVIAGGESGPGARPAHPDWFRSLRDQCAGVGGPFFFKQWGEWTPCADWYADHPRSLPVRAWTGNDWTDDGIVDGEWMARIGKKTAGRQLDGVEHNGMPEVR